MGTTEHTRPDFAVLLGRLKSTDSEERKEACKSLGKMAIGGDSHVIRPLIRLLNHQDYLVRYNACDALGNIGEVRAVKPIIARLKDEEEWVRETACRALGNIGNSKAIEPLLERLDDSFDKVREAAFRSLVTLGEGRLAKALKEQNINSLIRIAKNGDPRPVDKIIDMVKKKIDDPHQSTEMKKLLLEIHAVFAKNPQRLLCQRDFTRFEELTDPELKIGLRQKVPWFACRKCGKTIYGKHGIANVVAVLDTDCKFEVTFDSSNYHVNYFAFNQLFDFNRIEIIKTTDKAIENLGYKVSKDTDPVRKQNYKKVRCMVSPNSGVSETSKHILRSVFGNVVSP